ncbi:hypothetical protein P5673_013358 [Acropora cervicornis]|uniref:Uncharacterized protein n=1 Tax=Acropora cervicornis TaxID=6130 RepID=A0AAD9QLV4_ACRCE|nr:hypothetical protein P5673_013358 [Acropora cervicornis]
MFRVAGTGGSPDKATLDEERKKNSENVWFTLKVFASYVAFLRLVSGISSGIGIFTGMDPRLSEKRGFKSGDMNSPGKSSGSTGFGNASEAISERSSAYKEIRETIIIIIIDDKFYWI